MTSTVPLPTAAGARIDLRVLVVARSAGEASATSWAATLDRTGVPFDLVVAGSAPLTRMPGRPGCHPVAAGPLHARYQAVVTTAAALEVLHDDERATLGWLADTFGVRQLIAYAYPGPAVGLTAEGVRGANHLPTAAVTAAGSDVFGGLAGPVPIDTGAWGYPGATPAAGADWTTLVAFPDGSPAIGLHREGPGREQLVCLVDANAAMLHGRLLAPDMLRWVTHGIHLGHARQYLSLHVDDVLLANDRWGHSADRGPIRMTPADVERAVAWSARSGLTLDLVFNGHGVREHGADPLYRSLVAHRDAFRWINHTYSHRDLDDPAAVDVDVLVDEIRRNLDFATTAGLDVDATELVTGGHSGLGNARLATALPRTPVRWLADDSSQRPEPTAIGTARTVPRHPMNLYHDAGTVDEQLAEYHHRYPLHAPRRPARSRDGVAPVGWDAFVDAEATTVLDHILANDPRPHFVHQSNLAEDGLLYLVLDEVADRHARLCTTPLLQPGLAEAGRILDDRLRWRHAVASGRAGAHLQDGRVHLWASEEVPVPVSGVAEAEAYGPGTSGWVVIAGSRTLFPADTTPPHPRPYAPPTTAAHRTTEGELPPSARRTRPARGSLTTMQDVACAG